MPPVDPAFGIYGSITPAMVADALRACPDAAAVILTSPTYEGVLSDLAAIAALCHAANVPLIVDEAHGAHYLHWPPPTAGRAVPLLPGRMSSFKARTRRCPA